MYEVQLGSTARDMVTGFVGVVAARTMWLTGCATVELVSKELKDGVPLKSQWFDENRLEFVSDADGRLVELLTAQEKAPSASGGPHEAPERSIAGG